MPIGDTREPVLLTPGPLTTTVQTKHAQLRDFGSRDAAFIAMTRRLVTGLNDMVHGGESHACILLQGSGTFAVEAALGTIVPKSAHVLVCINGEYGRRIATIQQPGPRTAGLNASDDQPERDGDARPGQVATFNGPRSGHEAATRSIPSSFIQGSRVEHASWRATRPRPAV